MASSGDLALRSCAPTGCPAKVGDGWARVDQLDARAAEEGHGKIAGEMHAIDVESDVDGEGFDEVLAIVAVVEGTGAEEEGDRCIDGGTGAAVPGDAEVDFGKIEGGSARDGEIEGAQHRGGFF